MANAVSTISFVLILVAVAMSIAALVVTKKFTDDAACNVKSDDGKKAQDTLRVVQVVNLVAVAIVTLLAVWNLYQNRGGMGGY